MVAVLRGLKLICSLLLAHRAPSSTIETSMHTSLRMLEETRLLEVLTRVIGVRRMSHLLALHDHIHSWVLLLGMPTYTHMIREWLLSWTWEGSLTVLVKENAIVLSVCLHLAHLHLVHLLLLIALITKLDLTLDLIRLLSWHELLSMLIRVSQLTASLNIKIFLRATITMSWWLAERRMGIWSLASSVLFLQTFSWGAHSSVHQSRSLVWVLFIHARSLLFV